MKKTLLLAVLLGAAGLPSLPRAALGADEKGAENLRDDIRFSRDLARYRFFDLAVEWLGGIEKTGGLDAESKVEVSLAKATISRLASEYALTRQARMSYYDDAITHYEQALQAMAAGMNRDKGEATVEGLAKVQTNKGKFYTDEIARLKAENAAADKVKEVRGVAEEAFRTAVKTLNTAYSELSDAASAAEAAEDTEAYQVLYDLSLHALYRKGEAYFFWALLYEPQDFNREDYLVKCTEALVDYIWEAGDESIFALYAYYYQGMAEWELGKVKPDQAATHDEKALASLTHIYSDYGIDLKQLPGLPDEERRFVLGLVERAYAGVSQVYRAAASRFEAAQAVTDADDLSAVAQAYLVVGEKPWMTRTPVFKPALVKALRGGAIEVVTELRRRLEEQKLGFTEDGYRALLAKARALQDAGNPAEALTLAKEVAQNNEGSLVGLEAQTLLGDLLAVTDESAQPPAVLRLVADGYIAESRWPDAVGALHGVIRACRNDTDVKQFVTAAWTDIGGCYQSDGRHLEAALAFEAGFAAAKELADESAVGDLALGAYNAWDRRFRETRHDYDRDERNRVRDIVTSLGISGDIQFLVAKEAFSNAAAAKDPEAQKKLYETAVNELKAVAESSNYYERALVFMARAEAGAGKADAALKTFDALLARIADEKHAVGFDRKKSQQRGYAHAEAVFYRAGVLLDMSRFQEVFDSLAGYESKFEDQAGYFPNVFYYRVRAKVGAGQFDEAEELLGKMEATYAGHGSVPYAINQVASGFFTAYQNAADKTAPDALAHLRKAADYLDRYNSLTGYGSFANLLNVADWNKQLGDPERALENYSRLMERFGKKPQYAKTINDQVNRSRAEVYLTLQRFPEALPLWREVYTANRRDRAVVRDFARCLGGWLEEKEDRGLFEYKEIPGAGEYQEAMKIWMELKKGIEDAGDKSSAAWWECNASFVYCQYMAAKQDPTQAKAALGLVANWRALYPDLGGEPWRRRIQRLERALPQ